MSIGLTYVVLLRALGGAKVAHNTEMFPAIIADDAKGFINATVEDTGGAGSGSSAAVLFENMITLHQCQLSE